MIALVLSVAFAADPVLDAVRTELDRATSELRLPEAPGPYHVAALVYEHDTVSVQATLGAVVGERARPSRSVGISVRAGSPALDNTNFDSWQTGIGARGLVAQPDALAIRKDVWLLVDRMYKESLEALAAKEAAAARRAEPDDVPDFAPGEARVAAADRAPAFDPAPLQALARELSAVFVAHPGVEFSMVFVDAQAGRRLMVDTGGVEVVEPSTELAVRVVARARAADGATQIDQASWIVRTADQLPAVDALKAEVGALAKRLETWRVLPVLDEEYVGPVLFEDAAAVDVVRHVLVPSLLGTPAVEEPAFGTRVVSFGDDAGPGPMQPRRRILPTGWSVDDDPGRDPARASAYLHDWEGQPAQKVELVRDGIVRGHLMSRIPSEAFPASNGHGRAEPGDLVRAMAADLAVTPAKTSSPRALHKAATKLAGQYDLDHYLVIRRLREGSIEWMDGGPLLSMRDLDGPTLSAPIEVVRVYGNGRQEILRGAGIGGLDVRALKEVVLAGAATTATYLEGEGARGTPNAGFPVTVTAPDLLFGELVVSPDPKDAEKPPRLPSPLAGG